MWEALTVWDAERVADVIDVLLGAFREVLIHHGCHDVEINSEATRAKEWLDHERRSPTG